MSESFASLRPDICGAVYANRADGRPMIRDWRIRGWAALKNDDNARVTVHLYIDGEKISKARADIVRANTRDGTDHREQTHGFNLTIPPRFGDGLWHDIDIAADGHFGALHNGSFRAIIDLSGAAQSSAQIGLGAGAQQGVAHDSQAGKMRVDPEASAAHFERLRERAEVEDLFANKRWEEAERKLTTILQSRPSDVLTRSRLAFTLTKMNRRHEAAEIYQVLAGEVPDNLSIVRAAARNFMQIGAFARAADLFGVLIRGNPADVDARSWYVDCLAELQNWEGALEAAKSLKSHLAPQVPPDRVLVIIIRMLLNLGRPAEALCLSDEFLELLPESPRILQHKGDALLRLARYQDAEIAYRMSLKLAPQDGRTQYRLGNLLLLQGKFDEAFDFQEGRKATSTFRKLNDPPNIPLWKGDISVQSLLVWCEGGFGVGQNILCAGLIPELQALGVNIELEAEPRLAALFERSFEGVRVTARNYGDPRSTCSSAHIPIGSLTRYLRRSQSDFDFSHPYLRGNGQRIKAIRSDLLREKSEGARLVGISWGSSNPFVGDEKSMPLAELMQSLDIPGIVLVNLQYGDHAVAIEAAREKTGVDLACYPDVDNTNDLVGLSDLIASLDLVVCIGHTTAHMAGALGVPNIVMLPASPFAHWLAAGEGCVWYPGSVLIRQEIDDQNNWSRVLAEVRGRVSAWMQGEAIIQRRQIASDKSIGSEFWIRSALSNIAYVAEAEGEVDNAAFAITRAIETLGEDPEFLFKLGNINFRQGFLKDAEKHLLAAERLGGSPSAIGAKLVEVYLEDYRILDAEERLCRERSRADSSHLALLHGRVLRRLGRPTESLDAFRTAQALDESIQGAAVIGIASALIDLGDLDGAEEALSILGEQMEFVEQRAVIRSMIRFQQGDIAGAIRFASQASVERDHSMGRFLAGQYLSDLRNFDVKYSHFTIPPIDMNFFDSSHEDIVAFICVDDAYLRVHAIPLALSMEKNSPQCALHMHIINPGDDVVDLIDRLRRAVPSINLSTSTEVVDFGEMSDIFRRTYFASMRFVRAYQIMCRYQMPFFIMDADCIVLDDIHKINEVGNEFDILIKQRFHEYDHLSVAAGGLFLNATDGARTFMSLVADRIKRAIETGQAVWFLDQIALSEAVTIGISKLGVRVGQLPLSFIDWYFQDGSVVWTGKGKRKFRNERYLKQYNRLGRVDNILSAGEFTKNTDDIDL